MSDRFLHKLHRFEHVAKLDSDERISRIAGI